MQFVWKQRDVEYEYLTSEGPVNVEATDHYEMTFLEMLHYPDLPHLFRLKELWTRHHYLGGSLR